MRNQANLSKKIKAINIMAVKHLNQLEVIKWISFSNGNDKSNKIHVREEIN